MSVLLWMVYYAALAFYLPFFFVLCLEEWVFFCLWLVITRDRFFSLPLLQSFMYWKASIFQELSLMFHSPTPPLRFSRVSILCRLYKHYDDTIFIFTVPASRSLFFIWALLFWLSLLPLLSESPWALPDLNNNATHTHRCTVRSVASNSSEACFNSPEHLYCQRGSCYTGTQSFFCSRQYDFQSAWSMTGQLQQAESLKHISGHNCRLGAEPPLPFLKRHKGK